MDINQILVSKDSKVNFLKGLIRVGKCDGKYDESEKIFFYHAALSLGLGEDEITAMNEVMMNVDTIDITFSSSEEKMFFFVQAIQLCWIDGGYTENERKEIFAIAEELSISPESILKVEEWVKEGMEWHNRGNDLLFLQ